ncbi:MAG TPA: nucleotide exchange factor GrpE [Candidatus Omnitrophota bacterium]|mgnify:CR=1 FL=1|nr:nucleotide exchange factor GrpE [Candidatus Omnitrophota bacterium]
MSEKEIKKNNHKQNNSNGQKEPKVEPPPSDEVVSIPKKELDELRAKAAERDNFHDKYMRAHAEFENARRRIEKDKADFVKYANDSLIAEFLPVFDNMELAEKHIKEAKDFKAVREGVDMIQLQMQKLLKDIGVERIKTLGEKFDPHQHEALEVEETEDKDKEDGLVTGELKPGYKFNGRLLRPASVKIVKRKS